MGYILVVRNPKTKKLLPIVDPVREDTLAEFSTEEAASIAARNTTACKAWGYQVIEVEMDPTHF